MSPEEVFLSLQLELPPPPKPIGVYKPMIIVDDFAYVSGHGPFLTDGSLMLGRVGDDVDLEGGYAGARQVGLAMLSTLRHNLGNLNRIKRVVKVLGMVNCTPDFKYQPKVINGFSDLLREIWGEEHGVGARSAVGMMLPDGIIAEIEAIFQLHGE